MQLPGPFLFSFFFLFSYQQHVISALFKVTISLHKFFLSSKLAFRLKSKSITVSFGLVLGFCHGMGAVQQYMYINQLTDYFSNKT